MNLQDIIDTQHRAERFIASTGFSLKVSYSKGQYVAVFLSELPAVANFQGAGISIPHAIAAALRDYDARKPPSPGLPTA